jgi:hypothetical protein
LLIGLAHHVERRRVAPRVEPPHLWLATACFLLVCGAGAYEHVVLVPVWTADPPASLAMFHGLHPLESERWWRVVHGPTLLLELVALVLLRGQARRRFVAIASGGYVVVLAVTLVWFVPELLALIEDPNAGIPAVEWKARADRWELLSLVRLAVMLLLGAALLRAVSEPATPRRGIAGG